VEEVELGVKMTFEILAIRLLVSILDRLMFPHLLDLNRDRQHQLLISNALKWVDEEGKS
jgi:hypothetical protein